MTDDQFGLFSSKPVVPFRGADYVPSRDEARLTNQIDRVLAVCKDGQWRTLQNLCRELSAKFSQGHFPEASVSAQLRNLRKTGIVVERRHQGDGLYEYRVVKP